MVWILVGCAVLIGVVVLIGREGAKNETAPAERATAEDAEYTKVESVQSGESLLEASGTIGQTEKSAPQVSIFLPTNVSA